MDNNNKERKNAYRELMNFAILGMSENAQFSVAIAVGIFGILAIFVSLDTHKNMDEFFENALWTQSLRIRTVGVVLSIAYWALVLFGVQSYITRRLFEGIMGNNQKKMNEEWFYDDIKEIAKENKLANWMVKTMWSSNHEKKGRYKGAYKILFSYIGTAFLLWLFIIIF